MHGLAPALAKISTESSSSQTEQKVLTTVAWPRALHAASTVHIAGQSRGQFRDSVCLSQNTLMDPAFFLWDSLRQFRRFANPGTEAGTMDLAAWVLDRRKEPGPCGVLAARLSDVGWSHVQCMHFEDQDGEVDVFSCSIQELKIRLKRAWHHKVGGS